MNKPTEMYTAWVHCSNCGAYQEVKLPKGYPVKDRECEYCACLSLKGPK